VLGCIALYFTCLLSHFSEVIKTVHLVQRMMIGVGELLQLLPDPNALVVIRKGVWAVKPCSNRILQF